MISHRALALILALMSLPVSPLATDPATPRIEVFKARRELQLFYGAQLIKTYHVALGTNPIPPKEREGDRATPEGTYFVCQKNPKSKFHLSLGLNYPNATDAARGLKAALITDAEYQAILQAEAAHQTPPWNTALGGEIFIHGGGICTDWTWGCVALADPNIEELYNLVPLNTPVTIHP